MNDKGLFHISLYISLLHCSLNKVETIGSFLPYLFMLPPTCMGTRRVCRCLEYVLGNQVCHQTSHKFM